MRVIDALAIMVLSFASGVAVFELVKAYLLDFVWFKEEEL